MRSATSFLASMKTFIHQTTSGSEEKKRKWPNDLMTLKHYHINVAPDSDSK